MVLEQFIIDADITWDQVGKTFFENPEAKPGRIMRVQVVNAGIIEDLAGYTLNLGWTSVRDPSKFGLDAFDDVDITKGIFEIEYTSGMLTNVGPLNASLQLVPPGEGRPIESNNFKLTVKNSAINPEAIQGETSFKALENALVEVNGWNTRIDAVEADFIQRANDMEVMYPQELVLLKSQLTETATKAELSAIATPLVATLVSQMTNVARIYVYKGSEGGYTNGNWYYHNGTTWVSGGVYQATGLADGSVTTEKISDTGLIPSVIKGVDVVDTEYSVNLFDKGTIIPGGYYGADGVWVANASYVSTDFIPITTYTTHTATKTATFVRWDTNKQWLGGGNTKDISLASPTAFVTFNMLLADVDTMMFTVKSLYPAEYTPYKKDIYGFDDTWREATIDVVNPEIITGIDRIIERTVNLFDKDSVRVGGKYNATTGAWETNASYVASDYIPVTTNLYKMSKVFEVVRWDTSKIRIGGGNTQDIQITSDTAFVTINMLVADAATAMMAVKSRYPLEYTPYMTNYLKHSAEWDVDKIDRDVSVLNVAVSHTYTPPVEITLADFSGYNQPYHPSVVYIPGGFNGYQYWMVQSPYPVGGLPYRDRWECPIVYKSNSGTTWLTVANPLDDLTAGEIANKDYMSDNHIVYRPDTNTLEVWYRYTQSSVSGLPTRIYRKTTTDGVNWTTREIMIPDTLNTDVAFVRSPSVLWDNVNKVYRLWYTNNDGVFYNTISDGGIWNGAAQQVVTLDDIDNYWHIDVNYFNGEYHFLGFDNGGFIEAKHKLVHYTSGDGLAFVRDRELLATIDKNPIYFTGLYRSCSLVGEAGKILIYFSGVNEDNKTTIGLITTDNIDSIQGVKKLNSNMVRLEDGRSLEELSREVARLTLLLNA